MTREERSILVDRYAAGPDEVEKALAGLPADRRTARPLPGQWSAAEIVHHLADSETLSAVRIRRLVAEERAVLTGYDQERYARVLRYNERDIGPSLAQFRAVRAGTVPLLRMLGEDEWTRQGWHTEMGPYTPEDWLRIYAAHAHDHAAQISRLREALG
jgi:hypothetical protein